VGKEGCNGMENQFSAFPITISVSPIVMQKCWMESLKEKTYLADLGVDGRITLK
jgi:hypothetical protein